MREKYLFQLQGRNPDVLNSIANLSSDEVFTPPAFANNMLDQIELAWANANNGQLIWSDPNLRFLDPFTKSGVFLREIVKRLNVGLEPEIPDLQERVDHILTKQVFGAATTTLTALLARRTVYCSKEATGRHSIATKFTAPEGNIWFEQGSHEWHGGSISRITLDDSGKEIEIFADSKCKICGVSRKDFDRAEGLELHAYDFIHNKNLKKWIQKVFGADMQFDVIIGNPPYQLDDGGFGASAAPIYNKFTDQAKALNPRFLSLVIPARWYAGGKGLDDFRSKMLNDNRVRRLVDFPDSSDVFPGVEIKGGVCYFLWDRDNPGLTLVETVMAGKVVSSAERPLLENGAQVFIRYNQGVEILKKVMSIELEIKEEPIRVNLPIEKSFKAHVSSSKPFGLRTFFQGRESAKTGDLKVFINGGVGYASKDEVTNGHHFLGKWKVFISGAYGAGNSYPHSVLGKPFVGGPEEICTETYMAIGPFETKLVAENVAKYISTKFFRALVLLHKPAQHATQSVYTFVPNQDFSHEWTDQKLFEKYNLSAEDIAFIDQMVRPMELDNE